ncbi:hypothetical protein BI004_gp280 [Bacillus phage NotTheCreek]|uniref:Uncharacterized protein n=2 Tax=Wphvirus TaxID=1922327 RepID=A0A222Z4E9_9CAUD|nr:hypothetical protein BIZ89_gp288 [Bacillus phage Kida]YP_009281087.1 hypothetical protein SAGEFAYGE_284 [Bacillus phage SageFayge]YP_009284608.1 hypothetical protein BI004_gp280 [Bacillus phage NotTheCreek]ASR78465.1 hypothetical protein PPISBEST_285 [Bacillus phage PPIsBest]QDH49558.1 hypothetical protein PHIREBALL_284 [Bacillus phage Phireball]QDH50265.1 hypothetical protein ALPS_279 [Bacillus phage ALPS]AMW63204.1 hypothetical protein SAGEFAYGE_284 [Bacillus phage SageFayge]AMW63499.1 
MVKRLTDREISMVHAGFTPIDGNKVSFSLTEEESNTLYCSLIVYNKESLKRLFNKSRVYELTYEDLEQLVISLGQTTNNDVKRVWDILEFNTAQQHPVDGWVTGGRTPRDGGYRLFLMLENAYVYFSGKDIEYND